MQLDLLSLTPEQVEPPPTLSPDTIYCVWKDTASGWLYTGQMGFGRSLDLRPCDRAFPAGFDPNHKPDPAPPSLDFQAARRRFYRNLAHRYNSRAVRLTRFLYFWSVWYSLDRIEITAWVHLYRWIAIYSYEARRSLEQSLR